MEIKRGQITIFILFIFVILIMTGFLFYINQQSYKGMGDINQLFSGDIALINNYVNSCLKITGINALELIGIQGGFYDKPLYSVDTKGVFYNSFNSIYIHNFQNAMPSLQTVERELSKYVENNIGSCINDFQEIKNLGYEIEKNDLSSTVTIGRENAIFNLNFPLLISKGNKLGKLENFLISIPSRLDLIYILSRDITNDQITHMDQICVSCLIEYGDNNGLYFEIIQREENITLIVVEDTQTIYNNDPYKYIFGFNHSIAPI